MPRIPASMRVRPRKQGAKRGSTRLVFYGVREGGVETGTEPEVRKAGGGRVQGKKVGKTK